MWGPIIKIVATGVVATVAGKLAKDQLSKIKMAPPAPAQPGNPPITVVAEEPTPRRSFFRVGTQQVAPLTPTPPQKKTSYLGWTAVALAGFLAVMSVGAIKGGVSGATKILFAKAGGLMLGKAASSGAGKVTTGVTVVGTVCLIFSRFAASKSDDHDAHFSIGWIKCERKQSTK